MAMQRRRIVAVDTSGGTPVAIDNYDTAGKQRVYLEHLRRHGVKAKAAAAVKTSIHTVRNWRRDDPDFREAEQDALATVSGKYQYSIHRAAVGGDIEAAKWLLERTNREEFSRQVKVQQEVQLVPRLAPVMRIHELPMRGTNAHDQPGQIPTQTSEDDPGTVTARFRTLPGEGGAQPGAADGGEPSGTSGAWTVAPDPGDEDEAGDLL